MVDTPFANNIRLLKRIYDLSFDRLGEIAGLSGAAAHKWTRGGDIQDDNVKRLADHFGIDWLDLKYKPLRLTADQSRVAYGSEEESHPQPGELPLISSVAASGWSEAFDPYAPGAAEDWPNFGTKFQFSPHAFALRVRGDSMENPKGRPTFPDGCLIAVEPALRGEIRSGDLVVVRHNDWDEATFKQYIRDAGHSSLKPLNPQHQTQPMPYDAIICGKVVARKIPDEIYG